LTQAFRQAAVIGGSAGTGGGSLPTASWLCQLTLLSNSLGPLPPGRQSKPPQSFSGEWARSEVEGSEVGEEIEVFLGMQAMVVERLRRELQAPRPLALMIRAAEAALAAARDFGAPAPQLLLLPWALLSALLSALLLSLLLCPPSRSLSRALALAVENAIRPGTQEGPASRGAGDRLTTGGPSISVAVRRSSTLSFCEGLCWNSHELHPKLSRQCKKKSLGTGEVC
jgi:hypothetical protein